MPRSIVLSGGSVLVDGAFVEADLVVEDGRIAEIRRASFGAPGSPKGAELVALPGTRILPGFIDIHTHGGAGVDFNLATRAELPDLSRFYASRGVTSVLPTILTDAPETMERQLDLVTEPALLEACPEFSGVHLEGPFLCSQYRGAQPEAFLRAPDPGLFDRLQRAARGGIRLLTLSPELKGSEAFTREAVARGLRVSIGHSAAGYEAAMAAIAAGAASATHVMNAMKPLHMHDPGILCAALESDIYAEMICDGFHLHPPIVRLLLKVKGLDRMIAVTDSIMAAGLPDGDYFLGVNEVRVAKGDATLKSNGVRAGSTLTMDAALRNIRSFTGLGLESISRLVSENPARLLGLFGETGSIEAGKRADLVALDAGWQPRLTMARGRVTFGPAALS